MPYITREDGEHFVVPSYRDILSAKKSALLKKEILLLSANYGNFITLQRKNADQYEAAFANDAGYLLGESIWHFFKQPTDLIYCEALPGTTDALLVIVKSGSVYLDGTFPIDSIPDELVIFKTQLGKFHIYISGDVPISENPEPGKISFEPHIVASFTVLPNRVFPTLPLISAYKLVSANTLLKKRGIGAVSTKKIIIFSSIPALLIIMVLYFSIHKEQTPHFMMSTINPWQNYLNAINSTPTADSEIRALIDKIKILYSAPGWNVTKIKYENRSLQAAMISINAKIAPLFAWASQKKFNNEITIQIIPDGVFATLPIQIKNRDKVSTYSPIQEVVATVIDRINSIWLGMTISIGDLNDNGTYSTLPIMIAFESFSIDNLSFLASQLSKLPLILSKADIDINSSNGTLTGKFTFNALGK